MISLEICKTAHVMAQKRPCRDITAGLFHPYTFSLDIVEALCAGLGDGALIGGISLHGGRIGVECADEVGQRLLELGVLGLKGGLGTALHIVAGLLYQLAQCVQIGTEIAGDAVYSCCCTCQCLDIDSDCHSHVLLFVVVGFYMLALPS